MVDEHLELSSEKVLHEVQKTIIMRDVTKEFSRAVVADLREVVKTITKIRSEIESVENGSKKMSDELSSLSKRIEEMGKSQKKDIGELRDHFDKRLEKVVEIGQRKKEFQLRRWEFWAILIGVMTSIVIGVVAILK